MSLWVCAEVVMSVDCSFALKHHSRIRVALKYALFTLLVRQFAL